MAQQIDFEKLTQSAADAFAEHGIRGIGMRELARQCGVSLPTIYYYFGSKEKLFESVCDAMYERALAGVRASQEREPSAARDPRESLRALSRHLYELLTSNRTLFLLLRQDLIHGSQGGEGFRSRRQYEGLIALLRELLSETHDAPAAARRALLCASLIFGYCEFAVVSDRVEMGCEDLLDAVTRLALG